MSRRFSQSLPHGTRYTAHQGGLALGSRPRRRLKRNQDYEYDKRKGWRITWEAKPCTGGMIHQGEEWYHPLPTFQSVALKSLHDDKKHVY